jgi:hypothetical protein
MFSNRRLVYELQGSIVGTVIENRKLNISRAVDRQERPAEVT